MLREIAERRYGRVRKAGDFEGLLDRLFSDAIELLEEPERQAASHSFGLRRSDSYKIGDLKTRQENAAKAYSEATEKQIGQFTYAQKPEYERTIIVNTGQEIEKLAKEATERGQKARTESRSLGIYEPYTTPYVRRPHYHEEFEAALNNDYKIIAFVGPPGVGKGRLVHQILAAKVRECDSLLYLECGNPKNFINNIALALKSHEVQDRHFTDEQLTRSFNFLICSRESPTYVVLRNPYNTSFLHGIDPRKLIATIIIISNYHFIWEPHVANIEVRPPHPEEAMQITRYLLPDRSNSELNQLIGTVGCSPQALEDAANFLSQEGPPLAISAFCRTFTRNASLILESSSSDLLRRFQDTFEALQGIRPDAAEVLEHLIFLADFVPVELIVASIADKNDSAPEEIDVIHRVATRALKALCANSLISLDDGYVKLYKLAQTILRLTRSEKSDEVTSRLRAIIWKQIALVSREQEREPVSIEKFMNVARPFVNHLFHVENNVAGRRNHGKAGRETARAIQDLCGDFEWGPLVEIVPLFEEDELLLHKLTFRLDLTRLGESVRRELEKIANGASPQPD